MNKVALFLVILGAVNWGLVGIFNLDLIAYIFGGQTVIWSRIIYSLILIAGLWCISFYFRDASDSL